MTGLVKRLEVRTSADELVPDPSRVAIRLFLPGEDPHDRGSRVREIVERILALPEDGLEEAADEILASFGPRTDSLVGALLDHAATVGFHQTRTEPLSHSRKLVLGAAFTSEYAVEGAALCNPSAVPHPDQTGLEDGQMRVAVALRGIGEGHISSIGFATAVIGPGRTWEFARREFPLVRPTISELRWSREHFLRALESDGHLTELMRAVARSLPETFDDHDLEYAIRSLPSELAQRHDARLDLEIIRTTQASAYVAGFPATSELSQRVLQPVAPEEASGMEDARFVLITYPDGSTGYRATYTAYDGHGIAPRLIVSPDLVSFDVHRLSGSAVKNKGMALFPRLVNGEILSLTRTDGESLRLARSKKGRIWNNETPVHSPRRLWEIVQAGNCGSPIETERGWLVLTHGVGPMRRYCIGAILLDLDYPDIVIASLDRPLIEPEGTLRDGYVPNVVYSCGGVVHDGVLWLPYGVGDARVRVASVVVEDLLDEMAPA
ncbi:MAG: glycosylase [Demequinaceae bacterium]|nr:glycosylase [Demequinaceae bacterium]